MISPRLFAVLAAFAAVSALPATDRPVIPQPITSITAEDVDSPWFGFPLFGNLFAPIWKLFPSFADIGPKIIADDDKFQVVVNVKDYKKEDLKVKVKGEFIFVQGTQEAKQDDRDLFASQFFHTYTMPANSSSSDVSAQLTNDGYLIVTAPLNGAFEKAKDTDREVPIIETGAPYVKVDKVDKDDKIDEVAKVDEADKVENAEKTESADKVEPLDAVENADKLENVDKVENVDTEEKVEKVTTAPVPEVEEAKEPTTQQPPTPTSAPTEKEVTEKDNVIPHGNEVIP